MGATEKTAGPLLLRPPTAPRPRPERSEREVELNAGVHLVDSVLWFDTARRADPTFLSSALVEHPGKNRRVLCTVPTAALLSRGKAKLGAVTAPYGQRFQLGQLNLSFHPAGRLLGSAQLLVEREGRRVLYTNGVKLRPSFTAEAFEAVRCDALVCAAPYFGFHFPPQEEVHAQILSFVEETLAARRCPVLLASALGAAQELMQLLAEAGHRLRVHRSVHEVSKVYRGLGIALPEARRFTSTTTKDEVLILPPILRNHPSVRKLREPRLAWIGGRAADAEYIYRARVDAAFALSSQADSAELLRFVEESGARDVYLMGEGVEPFAQALRAQGLRVFPLRPPEQLRLL